MDPVSWAALSVAVVAASGAAVAAYRAGRIDGIVNNGLSESMRNIREDIAKIFERLNSLSCERHGERVDNLKGEVERLNTTISHLRRDMIKGGDQ